MAFKYGLLLLFCFQILFSDECDLNLLPSVKKGNFDAVFISSKKNLNEADKGYFYGDYFVKLNPKKIELYGDTTTLSILLPQNWFDCLDETSKYLFFVCKGEHYYDVEGVMKMQKNLSVPELNLNKKIIPLKKLTEITK